MVILAVLALTATPAQAAPPVRTVAAERQAVAMVRVLRGAPLRFAELEKNAPGTLSDTRIRTADGGTEPARLVEFE